MAGCGEFGRKLAQQDKLKKYAKLSKVEKLLSKQKDQDVDCYLEPWDVVTRPADKESNNKQS